MSLLNLNHYTQNEILNIINIAIEFKEGKKIDFKQTKIIANLFFEPSTRTHYSFEVAANKLGCKTLNFAPDNSSLEKGETLYDTIRTFDSFDIDCLVIRHSQNEYYKQLQTINTPILNAGDGSGNHPTQSLLDLLTIYEEYGYFKGLTIAIAGDIKHSRVARTNFNIMKKLGMNVLLTGPENLKSDYGSYYDIDDIIHEVDILMMLRVQNERHINKQEILDYNTKYGINENRVKKMKQTSIIMHPGPFNRGMEITNDVVECDKSRIFNQSNNGVYLRMAVIYNAIK